MPCKQKFQCPTCNIVVKARGFRRHMAVQHGMPTLPGQYTFGNARRRAIDGVVIVRSPQARRLPLPTFAYVKDINYHLPGSAKA